MSKEKNGFTVIEVSLVLALAGLIFLMVFVALPSLRRSQRDTSRREAAMELISEIKNFQQNNGRGNLPGYADTIPASGLSITASSTGADTSWAGFYRDFLGANYVDPDGERYNLLILNCGTTIPDASCAEKNSTLNKIYTAAFPNGYKMYIVLGSTCYGDKAVATSNQRMVSVLYRLEGAGVYCSNT